MGCVFSLGVGAFFSGVNTVILRTFTVSITDLSCDTRRGGLGLLGALGHEQHVRHGLLDPGTVTFHVI